MVNLTPNEKKVRKELLRFPNGAKASQLKNELVMSSTPLYRALNGLEEKELVFRGDHSLWYPFPISKIGRSDFPVSEPEESEQDKAQAIAIMKSCQALTGYRFSKDEWFSVLGSNDGKSILDKAKALTTLIYNKALTG